MSDNRVASFVRKVTSFFVESASDVRPEAIQKVDNALAVSGLDTSACAVGDLGAIKADTPNTVVKTDAHTSLALAKFAGVVVGDGWLQTHGLARVKFKSGLTLAANDPVYVCVTADTGKATNVKPAASGDYPVLIGTLVDPGSYSSDGTAVVLLKGGCELPVVLP